MSLYDSESKFLENLNAIDREIKRSKEDFIKEHFAKYNRPDFPPAWKTLELVSFGTLSKLYYNFSDNKIKKRIARRFRGDCGEHPFLLMFIVFAQQLLQSVRVIWGRL